MVDQELVFETITFGEIKRGSIIQFTMKYYEITLTEGEPIHFIAACSNFRTS